MQCHGTGKLSLLATNNLSDCIQLLMFNLVIFLSAARCLFFYRRQVSNPFLPSLLKLSDDDFLTQLEFSISVNLRQVIPGPVVVCSHNIRRSGRRLSETRLNV